MTFHEISLENGLRLLIFPDNSVPLVHTALLLQAGAKDEQRTEWGCAHLCEHLFFTGTKRAPHFDKLLSEFGGSSNAWTDHDGTVFLTQGPNTLLDRILWLEADRLCNIQDQLDRHSFETEKNVVLNELAESVEDQPFGPLLQNSWGALFGEKHPYGHSVIGTRESVEKLGYDAVTHFFKTHYAIERGTLLVVGAVESTEVSDLVSSYFSELAPSSTRTATVPQLERPNQLLHHQQERRNHNLLRWEWILPTEANELHDELLCLSELLTSARLGHLYHHVQLEKNWAHFIDSGLDSMRHATLFWIEAHVHSSAHAVELQSLLFELLRKPISTEKTTALARRIWRNRLLSTESLDARIEWISTKLQCGLSIDHIQQQLTHPPLLKAERITEAHQLLLQHTPMLIWGEAL